MNTYTAIVPFWPLEVTLKENYFLQPALVAKKLGLSPRIIVLQKNSCDREYKGIRISFISSPLEAYRILEKDSLIHIQTLSRKIFILLWLFKLFGKKRKIILTPHTSFGYGKPCNFPFDIYKRFPYLFSSLSVIHTVSPYEDKYLKRHHVSPTRYIPLPIDIEAIKKNKNKYLNKSFDLLFIGGDRDVKGLKEVLKAYMMLKIIVPDCQLHILGPISNDFIINCNAEDEGVIAYGRIKPFSAKYFSVVSQCRIYINNSLFEGPSLSTYEASAAGLGLCLSNLPTLKSIMKGNALYHHPEHPEELVKNILMYYNDYKHAYLLHKHIKKARKTIEKADLRNFRSQFQKLLLDVC